MAQQTKPTVTIGIPAYNEEANIRNLLMDIIGQTHRSFSIHSIIVVLDCCSDRTEQEIKKVSDERIIILKNRHRLGQALSQNKILRLTNTDYLVLLNADVQLNKHYIEHLLRPMMGNMSIGLVSGRIEPLKARTWFEEIVSFSTRYKNSFFSEFHKGVNPYMCHGRGRACSRAFYRKLLWPKMITEDAFTYFQALTFGLAFLYEPSAVLYFRSPANFADHLKQSVRFKFSRLELARFFPSKMLEREYHIPKSKLIKFIFYSSLKRPMTIIQLILFSGVFLLTEILSLFKKSISTTWNPALSSKQLS